ncbi:MAG: hypothetical protein K1000chlam2_00315 [Chlamydiae bacterium]|nr:hypothetical protein [Chlamydiota bacterium]
MKWFFAICTIGLLFFHSKGHFDPENLYTEIPKGSEETAEIAPLLNQPYTYLGEGSQFYAFASEDDCYVIKLFKAHHHKSFKLSRFLRHIKKTKGDQLVSKNKWKRKFRDTCRRYKMAFVDLKEETGLLYIHFQKSSPPLLVTFVDKYAKEIDISKHPFVLQKKALLAPEYFKLHPEREKSAKQALKELFVTRIEKGYSDPRQTLSTNYGFIEDTPIQIDVGKIEPFKGDIEEEIRKIHARIDAWTSTL